MHTKEPWSLGEEDRHGDTPINADDWHSLALVVTRMEGHKNPCVDGISNARRIVACVNACAGISTDNLEGNKPIIEELRILNNHRKELLDALKYAAGALGTDGHDPIVDAAIAKAEAA